MTVPFYQLMLVTHRQACALDDYLRFVETCARAGVTSVQLREKDASAAFLFRFAVKLKALLSPLHIPLIINDHVDLALAVNADGVHLGADDGCPKKARKQLGTHRIIGLSLESMADLVKANQVDVDYVAASAVFPTANKTNVRRHWGIDGLHGLAKQSRHPLIGIGGIHAGNLKAVIGAGAKGAAVIGAIHDAPDPVLAIQTLRALQR
ncbi:thiamine phosphate synthase [Legionella taurinensis]|uniref:Thiamine-phosphate synthase n=1 Tax=Legionella taurinensis TaxID=70611 RepID=A0A3A5LCT2_9GAMM|nr:thiamine phosphate synthase [Legionella taurinensis]MDX1837011.1 thiamine phosphate synthase [Legionella taurinensis]PUT41417.1 thiamine phosphate synthase [Legionella taurinensis]PUT42656.1 thiamine phosphate synthase [Legionella taurinensis]PUT46684.1 thiamine phosphate synthase [Legionella taurinensis]PUT47333.1 thiamine phosphate synthase [Legionella taurinensis]